MKNILNIKTIDIDIEKPFFNEIVVKQNDAKSRFINFRFLDNNKILDLTMITVRVFAKKADATLVFNNLTKLDEKKGLAQLEFSNQMLALAGTLNLELVLTKELCKFSTIPFKVKVIACINNDSAVESTNEFSALQEALKTISSIDNKADKTYVDSNINTAKANIEAVLNPLKARVDTNTLTFKRALGASENLNNITETGLYAQTSNANAESGTNYPLAKAGFLSVVFVNSTFIYQSYRTYKDFNKYYYRNYYSGTWGDWIEIATTSGFNMIENSILGASQLDVAKEINLKFYPGYGTGNCKFWLDGRAENKKLVLDGIQELAFNNGLVANGNKFVRNWTGYSTLTDGWIHLGGNMYLEWGFHNITSTVGGTAIKDNCPFVRNDYSKVVTVIPTSIKQDNSNADLSTALVTVLDWDSKKARFQCEFGYSTNPVRFSYIAIGVV